MKIVLKPCLILWSILLVVACSTHQARQGTTADEIRTQLYSAQHQNAALPQEGRKNLKVISQALMPKLGLPSGRAFLSKKFDIAVKNVPAPLFYMGLVKGTPMSIVVSPEIKGNITLNMKHVTIEQVLKALENTHGYIYHQIPGGYEVMPNTLQTKIYNVDYLDLERQSQSTMLLTSGEVTQVVGGTGGSTPSGANSTNSTTVNVASTPSLNNSGPGASNIASGIGSVKSSSLNDFWRQLQYTLEQIIGKCATCVKTKDRSVTVNTLAGIVVVRALPSEHKQVEAYLDMVQNNMGRQVMLEAKILEVTLSDKYQMGINWDLLGAKLNAISDFPGTDINLTEFVDAFQVQINWAHNFSTTIQALEYQGDVQVLSSPRVTTMNNQNALIKVGDDQFYVTNLVPNTTVAATPTTSSNSSFTPTFTPIFSGVTLDVTPQIDRKNNITLHIHPTISDVTSQTVSFNLSGSETTLPMAQSTIRESDTVVHAKNGQVVVIGGLMQNLSDQTLAEMPFLGNMPFLGTLFRNTLQNSAKTELVILIKPTVITKHSNQRNIDEAAQRMREFKRGYAFGARPDIFGTEGEIPVRSGPKAGTYKSYQRRRW